MNGLLALTGLLFLAGSPPASAEGDGAACLLPSSASENTDLKGKTLINALNPHTPGYEALDPDDPSKYVGFDVDLSETLGACLGFKVAYKPVVFAALLSTLGSGQADFVTSDLYATDERAKVADFITYSKIFDGVLVLKGNPKKITGIDTTLCGTTAAENTGYIEVPLVRSVAPACKSAGRPAADVQLYDNNSTCIQAMLTERADTYVNDVNTVDQAAKAYPDKLVKAAAVTLPYLIAIAVPKDKPAFRDAMRAALIELQKAGIEAKLLEKWSLDAGSLETPRIVSAH